jgi:hypothetical protein
MAYATSIRGEIAAPASTGFGFGFWRSITEAIVDSRRRKAIRELRRHQAFGPLISIKHIGLTRDELLPF